MRKFALLLAASAALAIPVSSFAATAAAPALDTDAVMAAVKASGLTCDLGPAKIEENNAAHWIIEFRCAKSDDGRLGVFPKKASETPIVYDCVTAKIGGYACADTKEKADYPAINADIRQFDYRSECRATQTRMMGIASNKKSAYLEIKCDDPSLNGQILQFDTTTLKPLALIDCTASNNMAGGCRLAGSTLNALPEATGPASMTSQYGDTAAASGLGGVVRNNGGFGPPM